MAKLPFVISPKLRHVQIGSEEAGMLWLIEKGGISPAESPVDVIEEQNNRVKAVKIYNSAAEKLAAKRDISKAEARRLLFGLKIKKADEDAAPTVELEDEQVDMTEYLTPEEVSELFKIQGSQEEFEIRTATLLIRHRVLYPVFLSAPANPELTTLQVKPLAFPIMAGDVIDFESFKVKAAAFADEGDELLKVEKIPGKLKADAYGFLMDSPGKKKAGCFGDAVPPAVFEMLVQAVQSTGLERVAAESKATDYMRSKDLNAGWVEADTRQLDAKLIHDIYRLYCREKGLPDPDLDLEDEVEEVPPLEEAKRSQSKLNGAKSTTDSDTLELVTTG